MRRAALVALLALAGCGAAPPPDAKASFRNDAAILASKADFAPDRMAGRWFEVARFPGGPACASRTVTYAPVGGGRLAVEEACDGAILRGTASPAGPGRQVVTLAGRTASEWILWTDTGYRTAIIVAPDGTAGRILDRAPETPPDRLRAALEVLDFNGFDAARLIFADEMRPDFK